MNIRLCWLVGILFLGVACSKTDDFTDTDELLIKNHISQQPNQDYTREPNTGTYYHFQTLGTGRYPSNAQEVEVRYKGTFLDGTVFYTTDTNTIRVALPKAIAGWRVAMPLVPRGSKVILLIPSRLGYGSEGLISSNPPVNIPANAVLRFEIELVEIHPHF